MASNSDTPGKSGAKPAPEPPKKPSALIDLKATEVDIKNTGQTAKAAVTVAEAAAKAAGSPPGSAAPAAQASAGQGVSAKGPGPAAATPGSSTSASSATASAASSASASSASPPISPPMRSGTSGGGLKGAATHLVAGLAGGLFALLGADALMPKSGNGTNETNVIAQGLDARLRQLEKSAAQPVSPELAKRLTAAETKLQEFDQATKQIFDHQNQLTSATKALGEKLLEAPAGGADAEKLARLEEILTTLSAAAQSDPQRGRIPQLAAISGKLADLESSVATQIGQLRKSVTQEVDSRLSQSADAAQAARAGTQRLDRELAGIKNEAAQIAQRLDGLNAKADKLETGIQGVREETAGLKAEVAREMKQVARSTEVSSALSPLTTKLSALEQNVQGVVRGEVDRRANVERIVTALELGNLKRTIERGGAFATELAEVRRVAGPKIDLSVLEQHKDRGVPALSELEREFKSVAFAIIDAASQPAQAHWTDRLIASAKSVVRVRKVDQGADDKSVEASVARMEQALKAGRLADVSAEAAKLAEAARAPARPWLDRVEARAAVERAITAIERELKASLGAQGNADKKG
jgi:hypothetical protein